MDGSRLTVFCGTAHPALAAAVAARLGVPPGDRTLERFPDGELHVRLDESVRGDDVYLVQPTGPPVEAHLFELLLLADACRRAGAAGVTAVLPYFGYARHDRRAEGREPVAARLVADLLGAGGVQRVVAVDLHTPALEGVFGVPLEHLSAVPLLAEAARPWAGRDGVVVAPDLGAAKLADRYARRLGLPVAVVHKTRTGGATVTATALTGDVRGRAPLLVDDMISTGGTVEAAARAVLAAGARPEVTVVASHGLFVGPAVERLAALPLRRLLTTDSLPAPAEAPLPLQTESLAALLAEAVERLHRGESLGDLLVHA
jgi:ribose-phosphate pyrophosphokinase